MTIVYSMDHRYGDAAILLQFFNIVKDILEDPENFDQKKYPELPLYEDRIYDKKQD